MSQLPTIEREDLEDSVGAERLDELLAEPFRPDDPELKNKMARRLARALEYGTAQLSLYIDLRAYDEHTVLYRAYAAMFALFHLEQTTRAGASKPSCDAFDLAHKNLGLAHKGDRLPGERSQRSTITAEVIEDQSRWSSAKMQGFE